jgi:hypothetical protein
VLISRGLKKSIQRELDSFYKEVVGTDFNIREVSKSAFTQSRANLKHESFIELNDNVNQTFYAEAPYQVWHHMRLLSADGSRLVLPKHPSVVEEFGEHGFGPKAESQRSLAVCSILYDCINLLTVDAQIAPYGTGERELLYKHLEKVKKGDLLLLDRGYPSTALFFLLNEKGIEFCVRMQSEWWLAVKEFKESGEKQRIISLKYPKKDNEILQDYPQLIDKEIQVRLVRKDLDNGETEILCTSLLDKKKYTYADLVELYHYRWNIEEGYKLYKARVELENFSGKTALAVKQDFFAKVFTMSLCAVLAFPIEERVKKESGVAFQKHPQKINRTNALSMLQNITIGLFVKRSSQLAIKAFDAVVRNTREIVRPGRNNERKRSNKKLHHMNYKAL